MAQLTQLKRKIQAVNTTKKITHAIRLVSMASYSKLEKQVKFLNSYKKNIDITFAQLLEQCPDWTNKILFPDDIFDKTPLIILISSTRGLCGSFNANLIRFIEKKLIFENNQKPQFITIGQKAKKEILSKSIGEIILSFDEFNYNNLDLIGSEITKKIYANKNNYSSVCFYSNKFINFFTQKPTQSTLIPTNLEFEKEETEIQNFSDPIYEQNKEDILGFLASKYIKSTIWELLFQSLISENASRFLAMDSSNTNAEKIVDKLTLQYNKSRQALITREVSELAANME